MAVVLEDLNLARRRGGEKVCLEKVVLESLRPSTLGTSHVVLGGPKLYDHRLRYARSQRVKKLLKRNLDSDSIVGNCKTPLEVEDRLGIRQPLAERGASPDPDRIARRRGSTAAASR
jgi:hypothetical protein